jgi:hypothetical protein
MALPTLPKKSPRPIAVTVRLSKVTVDNLKKLADKHNMSQADVIEHLITDAIKESNAKEKRKD